METTLEPRQMAKPKGRPKSDRDEATVKLARDLAGKAKAIALHRSVTVGELLTETFRATLDKMYAQMLRELEGRK